MKALIPIPMLTLVVAAITPLASAQSLVPEEPSPGFNRVVRPILSEHCFTCHGPDNAARKSKLRLDVFDNGDKFRGANEVVTPGDPENSLLFERLITHDLDDLMPPPEMEKPLTESQIAILADWIRAGAEYEQHWSYLPIDRSPVPMMQESGWARNPIDAFVLERLAKEGVQPSPTADPITLGRRLHFDLTGLPPEPGALDALIADPDGDAYEALVDQLLASPRYGEHMAVDWLDQVRYADTNGYHSDEKRSVWPYRDYVIQAFNDNMPFDQFTKEQLAGDLLPNATREQRVATAFNRMNQITAEGGAQAGEYLAMYAADRVRAVGSVWLGQTMGCAQCHDHKYDPISMKDFYSLASFFADVKEVGVYGGRSRWEPVLRLPTKEHSDRLAELYHEIRTIESLLNEPPPRVLAELDAWVAEQREALSRYQNRWAYTLPEEMTSQRGTEFEPLSDHSVLTKGPNPNNEVYFLRLKSELPEVTGIMLEALQHESFVQGVTRTNGNFVMSEFRAFRVKPDGTSEPLRIGTATATFEQDGHAVTTSLDNKDATGWAVAGHERNNSEAAVFVFDEPVKLADDELLEIRLEFNSVYLKHSIGRFRIALTDRSRPKVRMPRGIEPAAYYALTHSDGELAKDVERYLVDRFVEEYEDFDDDRAQLETARAELEQLEQEIPHVLTTEAVEPRVMRVLPRGDWMDESGEVVQPAVPEVLPALDTADRRATRLDLAEWIMSDENPLTARVVVNRMWETYFGHGLSDVLDDLGSQGAWPTHPELLDWLAAEFRDSGWDMKRLVKLIVMSNTYRQSSRPTPDLRDRDPANQLLARQGRFRLEAEAVRDNALAISGLLSDKIGGPNAYPYQPEGYYDNCNTFGGELSYDTSTGEEQYRRGLYTFWKRSFLHPSLMAFDAPPREECTANRTESNTPLQALVLLNDPTYVEAARVFAERLLAETQGDDQQRLTHAFERALSRQPQPEEEEILLALLDDHRIEFAEAQEAAAQLATAGQADPLAELNPTEVAAWTSVTRAILNLHETMTRY